MDINTLFVAIGFIVLVILAYFLTKILASDTRVGVNHKNDEPTSSQTAQKSPIKDQEWENPLIL